MGKDIGLADEGTIESYSQRVVDSLASKKHLKCDPITKKQVHYVPFKDAGALVGDWARTVNEDLCTIGRPKLNVDFCELSQVAGQFDREHWTLKLNIKPLLTKEVHVRDLEALATTIYHEVRHSEQCFAMAYYLCIEFPAMSTTETGTRLGISTLDVVAAAKRKARLPRDTALYEFGKKMYEGEYKNQKWEETQSELLTKHTKDYQTKRNQIDRHNATKAAHDALDYCEKVDAEITQYNLAAPTGMPKRDDFAMGIDQAFQVGQFWQELVVAFNQRQTALGRFYAAYWNYLVAKKLFALAWARKCYEQYMLSTLEDDAHTVETHLKSYFPQLGTSTGVGNGLIEDPKRWKAPDEISVREKMHVRGL